MATEPLAAVMERVYAGINVKLAVIVCAVVTLVRVYAPAVSVTGEPSTRTWSIEYPESAVTVNVWLAPYTALTDPDGAMVPPVAALAVMTDGGITAKFAVIVLLALIVTTMGLDVPDTSPDQLENVYPVAGAAVTVTVSPAE